MASTAQEELVPAVPLEPAASAAGSAKPAAKQGQPGGKDVPSPAELVKMKFRDVEQLGMKLGLGGKGSKDELVKKISKVA